MIYLDISLAGDSLIGAACDDQGVTREFEGRLGLLAAIDALARRQAPEHWSHPGVPEGARSPDD